MNCPNCSHINVNGAQFCGNCGTILPQQASTQQPEPFQQPQAPQAPTQYNAPAQPQPSQSPPNTVPTTPQQASPTQPPAPPNNQYTPQQPANPGPTVPQQNFPPGGGQPNQYPPTPPQQYSPPQNGVGSDFTIKVLDPKYLVIILLSAIASVSTIKFSPLPQYIEILVTVLFVFLIIYINISISKIKKRPELASQESEKLKVVIFVALIHIIALAFYYFRLNTSNPQLAKAFGILALKVIGLIIITSFLISMFVTLAQDSSTSNVSRPESPQQSTVAPTAYPASTKAEFINGCVANASEALCNCVFSKIQDNVSHDTFRQAEAEYEESGAFPPAFANKLDIYVRECANT